MATPKVDLQEERVLVLMPTGRDAKLVCTRLGQSNISAQACNDIMEIACEVVSGAGAILLAEEALKEGAIEYLVDVLNQQPIWSDLPILLFASSTQTAEAILEAVGTRINATIVERPIRITMLISAVRGALRARRRQYQARDLLAQLEQADRQKDLFLATLSHELRTPLNSMLGWIQLLRGGKLGEAEAAHAIRVIERNAQAQADLISDILFMSRVIAGKFTLKTQLVDLEAVISGAVDTVRPSIEAKRIHLDVLIDPNMTPITGDPDRLQQVIWNLLSNAIKFTPFEGKIVVRLERANSVAVITVSDTGQGIKAEFLPYVFERFRQADSTYTRQFGGLGLGLAIVRHLVELHGGSVRAESQGEGHGASFIVTLPISAHKEAGSSLESKPSEQAREAEALPQPLNQLRVLIVENDTDSREMLVTVLEQFGVNATAVASVAEALEAIEQTRPDVLISDIGMPSEDGYDLIRKLRALPAERGGMIPAIALTGYVSSKDRAKSISTGYQEHIAKPIEPSKLIGIIADVIKRNGNR
jgi:signal transduction histidine kinase/ActR/RegA family two-component response regulator